MAGECRAGILDNFASVRHTRPAIRASRARAGCKFALSTLLTTIALFAASTVSTHAQSNWTGAVSPNWFLSGNWISGFPRQTTDGNIDTVTPNSTLLADPGALARNLAVGQNGTGMLTIQTGGTLADSFGAVGNLPGGLGTVIVTGASSNWSNAGSVVVGGLGTGTLTIQNGGTVNSGGGSIGLAAGSTGTVTVTGPGSSWINGPSGGLNIGSFGTGTLIVANGGKVINIAALNVANIGEGAGSQGMVTVTGAGSTWSNQLGVNVGNSGTGTLTIADSGIVTGHIVIAANAGASGTLNIGAGPGNPAAAPGTLTAPSLAFGAGVGTLNFNHTSANYVFLPAISGNGAVNVLAGTTILTADSTYTGSTTISAGTLQLGNGSTTGSIVGDVTDNGTLAFNRGDAVSFPGVVSGTGLLTQAGSGTTILTAANTYSGGTTISAGTLQLGNGGASGSITGNVTDNGTLVFDRSDVVTFPGVVSGIGSVAQIGSGTTILAADSTYTGNTTIKAGTLQLGNGGTSGSVVGDVTDDAALVINRSDAVTLPGTISGSGTLTQAGGGTTILTADSTYTGGTTISTGTLQLGSGGTSGSIVGNVIDNGMLAFNRGDAVTFPGAISGSGSLAQIGLGTTILTANNTYTGPTNIAAGVLVIGDAAHPSAALSGGGPIGIAASATLGGYGSVAGGVANQGMVAVGNALPAFAGGPTGTFTVGGLLNQGAVNLAGSSVGNVLVVNRNYTGAGGTMAFGAVLAGDGSPADNLIINGGTASGSTAISVTNRGGLGALTLADGIPLVRAINGGTTVSGAFSLANPTGTIDAGFAEYRLFHGGVNGSNPGDWFLRSTFEVPPTTIPPTTPPPTTAPPTPPTTIPPTIALPISPVLPTDPPSDPLPPGIYPIIGPRPATYGVVQPIARQMGLTMLGTLHERIGDTLTMENADPFSEGWGRSGWARVFGQQIDNRYEAFTEPSATGRLFGVQAGFDVWRGSFIPGHRDAAGVYFGYGNSAEDVNRLVTNAAATGYVFNNTGKLNLDAYSGGVYWTHYGPGGWYFDAVLQGTGYDGTAETAVSKLPTSGAGFMSSLEAGYPIPLPLGPGFILEPQAQIIYQHVGFGDAFDNVATVALGSTSGATGRLGVRGQWSINTEDGQVWQPYVRANLWHDWGAEAVLSSPGSAVQVPLLETATRLEFAAGATVRINADLSFYAQAGYEFAVSPSVARRNGVKGDFGLRFTFGQPAPTPTPRARGGRGGGSLLSCVLRLGQGNADGSGAADHQASGGQLDQAAIHSDRGEWLHRYIRHRAL